MAEAFEVPGTFKVVFYFSNNNMKFSITTHVLTNDFDRKDNVLATIVIENEHTGEEIARLIEECLEQHGLKINSISACVRDDAANMQKSCRLLDINRQ